jgi:hypothetical protein
MTAKSFRKFVEDREAKSPHIDAMQDELGIDPRDLEKEPQVASFFAMGKEVRNIGPYRIISFKRDDEGKITHAVVRRYDDPSTKSRRYRDEDGGMVRMNKNNDSERMVVPIEDLDKLMSQDFQPPETPPGGMM